MGRGKKKKPYVCLSLQAQEDTQRLRAIVLPMEQEIAELKAKLAHAESLVQELQSEEVRWKRGTEGKVNIGKDE